MGLKRFFVEVMLGVLLSTSPALAEVELIGGTVTDQANWTASGFGRSGSAGCSYTVVGERVVLTAAHCVNDRGTFTFSRQGVNYSAVCDHHPQYSASAWRIAQVMLDKGDFVVGEDQFPVGATEDWAACVTNAVVRGVTYENVETDASKIGCQNGLVFTLSGYGCTRWGGSLDGQFRTGGAPAIQCPSASSQDLVTRGSSALCSGDSGGGAYLVKADGKRYYVGTNSRSNTTTTSYLSATFGPKFGTWFKQWLTTKGYKACGVSDGAVGCRDAGGGEEPDPNDCKEPLRMLTQAHDSVTSALASLRSCLND